MFKHYFEQIDGVEIFPIIALLIFFALFVYILIRVAFLRKSYIDRMRDLPLESNKKEDYEN